MASPVSTERTYLDYNATAPLRPEASRAMVYALAQGGNASSVHSEGRVARASIEAARGAVAQLVNAGPAGVIFTAGGTEANNLAIKGVIGAEGIARILVLRYRASECSGGGGPCGRARPAGRGHTGRSNRTCRS